MQLETKRLILHPFREEDVEVMAQLFANPDFMRFSLGVFTERKQTIAFIEKVIGWDRAGIPSQFAVVPHGEDAIIGYCGFFYHPEHGIEDIEIGYRLDPRYWNRGLITEAARAVRDHGFRDWDLSRVISLIHPENIPSRRVAEKNLGGSSTGSVFQDRLPKARRLAQAHAPRDHSLINAFAEMLAYLRHNLLAKVSPTIEHRHDNPAELEALVGA